MTETQLRNLQPWKPGQSGNPNGRPPGSRNAFSNALMADFADVWREHGRETVLHCALKSKEMFFATCARLIPRDVALTIETQLPGGLQPDDIAILRAIKAALPGAGEQEPTAVLNHVLEAVKQYSAKTIEPSDE
jgi:hypothetical protein